MTRFGLSAESLETLYSLFAAYPGIQKVILYGSRAMGNYRPGSDIDITLIADESFSYSDLVRLEGKLEESNLPYFVDVSIYIKLTSHNFIDHIQRVGKVLYERASEPALAS
jgi:predicted nucleotidyltransferase